MLISPTSLYGAGGVTTLTFAGIRSSTCLANGSPAASRSRTTTTSRNKNDEKWAHYSSDKFRPRTATALGKPASWHRSASTGEREKILGICGRAPMHEGYCPLSDREPALPHETRTALGYAERDEPHRPTAPPADH